MGPFWPDLSTGRKSHALRDSVISREDGALWYSETVAPKLALLPDTDGTLTATTRISLAPKLLGTIGVLLPHPCERRLTLRYWPQRSGGAVDCCQLTLTDAAVPVPTPLVPLTEYVCVPAVPDVVLHVEVVLEQFVHL